MEELFLKNIEFEPFYYDENAESVSINFQADLVYMKDRQRKIGRKIFFSGEEQDWKLWLITNTLHMGETSLLKDEKTKEKILNLLMTSEEFLLFKKDVEDAIAQHSVITIVPEVVLTVVRNKIEELVVTFTLDGKSGTCIYIRDIKGNDWEPAIVVLDSSKSPYLGYLNKVKAALNEKMKLYLLLNN